MRLLVLLTVFFAASSAARADLPQELSGRSAVSVEVEGMSVPVREVGLPIGAPVTRRSLRQMVRRLLATGRFADVQVDVVPEGAGLRVVVHLAPRIVLVRVDVNGNDVLDDEDVRRELDLTEGAELAEADLPAVQARLGVAYAQLGYEQVTVRATLRDTDDPARKVLILDVEEGEPTRILAVVFEGEAPQESSGVRRSMDLGEGDILDREAVTRAVERGQERLRELGHLEARLALQSLDRSGGGVIVRVLSHVGPRYQVLIRGYGQVPRTAIYDVLRIGEERPHSGVILAMEGRVTKLVQRYGFPDAEVSIRRVQAPEESAVPLRPGVSTLLLVDVRTGDPVRVVGRSFPGARHLEGSFLDEQIDAILDDAIDEIGPLEPIDDLVARRLLVGPESRRRSAPPLDITPAEVWYESAYTQATEHIQELYRADGFLAATAGPAQLERIDERRARVIVPVVEGPRTRLHRMTIEGNEALGDRVVLEAAGLERGQPFSYLALEKAEGRILEAYRDQGYYYASIERDVLFSPDRTRAEVRLRIIERFVVHIGEVRFEGLEQTSETFARRVLPVGRGDRLTPTSLRLARDRLIDLGVFSGVTVAPEDEDLPARVKNLVITVTERKTQYLDFTAGVSTGQGARFGVEYGYRNIGGAALQITARAQFGYQFFFLDETLEDRFQALSLGDRLERRVALVFTAPYVGIPAVSTSLSLSHQRENERAFGLTKNGIDLTFTWRPRRLFGMSVSGAIENNEIGVLGSDSYEELLETTTDLRLRQLLRVPEGTSTLVATEVTASVDFRDSPFTPSKGFYATVTAEYARTLRPAEIERDGERIVFDSNHVRLLGTFNGYIPLGDKVVLATQLRLGRVVHLTAESKTYPNRQFFLGGVDTVRGYLQDSMVPQDLAEAIRNGLVENTEAVVQGGDSFMVLRGELRFPIFGDIGGGAFVDLGNTWIDTGGRPFESGGLNPIELRPTAGLGLRINTPVGPIAFDYGILLLRRTYLNSISEPFGSFHFSIGLF
ncbi:MAG: BamA/TamA family outer membrane protein [Deltaproteobacteria bacterium]|nr:BamA/TamA family outer membrane protein [Deltaproteobacteria bacterium]